MRLISILAVVLLITAAPSASLAQVRVESNVVYGMYSGTALLMDVHHPADPNGYGIVFIPGSGWHEPLSFDAEPLKIEIMREFMGADLLLENGYTLFSINHRAAPGFQYPAAVEDAQRAVRYVRYHADQYGVDPTRIGALGHSSGGHLVSMLGALDGDGDLEDPSPINRQSSKVQAVVSLAGPSDLAAFASGTEGEARTAVSSFVGTYVAFFRTPEVQRKEVAMYAEASPTSHVSPDDPPFLLVHGDADTVVPFSQSELLRQKLVDSGATVELIRIPVGDHLLETSESGSNVPDYLSAMLAWLDRHLQN